MTEIILTTLLALGGGVITYLMTRVKRLEEDLRVAENKIDDLISVIYTVAFNSRSIEVKQEIVKELEKFKSKYGIKQ